MLKHTISSRLNSQASISQVSPIFIPHRHLTTFNRSRHHHDVYVYYVYLFDQVKRLFHTCRIAPKCIYISQQSILPAIQYYVFCTKVHCSECTSTQRGACMAHDFRTYYRRYLSYLFVVILCKARTTGIPSIEKFIKILLILRLLVDCWCFLTLIDKKKVNKIISHLKRLFQFSSSSSICLRAYHVID